MMNSPRGKSEIFPEICIIYCNLFKEKWDCSREIEPARTDVGESNANEINENTLWD